MHYCKLGKESREREKKRERERERKKKEFVPKGGIINGLSISEQYKNIYLAVGGG